MLLLLLLIFPLLTFSQSWLNGVMSELGFIEAYLLYQDEEVVVLKPRVALAESSTDVHTCFKSGEDFRCYTMTALYREKDTLYLKKGGSYFYLKVGKGSLKELRSSPLYLSLDSQGNVVLNSDGGVIKLDARLVPRWAVVGEGVPAFPCEGGFWFELRLRKLRKQVLIDAGGRALFEERLLPGDEPGRLCVMGRLVSVERAKRVYFKPEGRVINPGPELELGGYDLLVPLMGHFLAVKHGRGGKDEVLFLNPGLKSLLQRKFSGSFGLLSYLNGRFFLSVSSGDVSYLYELQPGRADEVLRFKHRGGVKLLPSDGGGFWAVAEPYSRCRDVSIWGECLRWDNYPGNLFKLDEEGRVLWEEKIPFGSSLILSTIGIVVCSPEGECSYVNGNSSEPIGSVDYNFYPFLRGVPDFLLLKRPSGEFLLINRRGVHSLGVCRFLPMNSLLCGGDLLSLPSLRRLSGLKSSGVTYAVWEGLAVKATSRGNYLAVVEGGSGRLLDFLKLDESVSTVISWENRLFLVKDVIGEPFFIKSYIFNTDF
ncbi:hypothetical protein [Hydrogenivirga sp.]